MSFEAPKADRPLMPNFSHDDPRLEDYPWFVVRMTTDDWTFGLLLTTGTVAVISRITGIHEHAGIVWVDVELAERTGSYTHLNLDFDRLYLLFAPTSRSIASIRADAIVVAFELADT